jgi:hypothetical protein
MKAMIILSIKSQPKTIRKNSTQKMIMRILAKSKTIMLQNKQKIKKFMTWNKLTNKLKRCLTRGKNKNMLKKKFLLIIKKEPIKKNNMKAKMSFPHLLIKQTTKIMNKLLKYLGLRYFNKALLNRN